ncbi:MAG: SPOR domain-containing protein [Myxococcaceae bacterium]
MRDAHRMREKYDLSLDSRQVVSLLIGGIVVLGAVFVLGVLVGKKLAGAPRADHGPDLLTALDHKSDALERARAAPPLTFQDELTRPTPPAPVVVRPPATSPASAPATAAATPARAPGMPAPAASAIAPAATPVATVARPLAATGPATPAATAPPASAASSSASSKPAATMARGPSATTPATPTATPAPASATSSPAPGKPAAPGRAAPVTTVATATAVEPKSEAARPAHTESVATRTAPAAAAHSAPKVPEATSATGAFTLQLGASPSRDDAERQASRLREKGYAPYIVSAEVPGKGTWYRVRMGSFPTKDAATRYLQDFKRETQAEAFVASTR